MTPSISLLNFDIQQDIIINYPLIYLHGVVKSGDGKFINCKNRTVSSQETIQWPIKSDEFKVFVFLVEGSNEISLIVNGEDEVRINVTYTKESNCRYILPIYIICKNSDGSFISPANVSNSTEDAVTKIQLNARLMQTYFAESLYDHGFKRRTFLFAEDAQNKPLVKIVNSKLDIEKTKAMTTDDLYDSFCEELNKLLPKDPCRKLLVFMSCTRYNPPEDEKEFTVAKIMSYASGHAALGGGNMALFGTGSLHTWASNLSELNEKFSDDTLIDRTKLFDDSAGRGTHWANYSTTLGAAIHEVGHTFDLAHTAHGIMCRGHDDMNYFYTVVKPCTDGKTEVSKPTEVSKSTGCNMIDDSGKYKGAHWYRSSAVALYYNKWFIPSPKLQEDTALLPITKSLHPNLLGPVGNVGPCCQKDQELFNSQTWSQEDGLTFMGVVLYHREYLYGLQFLGAKCKYENGVLISAGEEQSSKVFGTSPESAEKTTFYFSDPGERITTIKIRAGAYVDGIEIETTSKCSGWIGGQGGDLVVYKIDNDRHIQACVGSAGVYVGSLGFILNSSTDLTVRKSMISFASNNGIRLVESRDKKGEVQFFREFLDDSPPQTLSVSIKDLFVSEKEKVEGMVIDSVGEKLLYSVNQTELEIVSQIE